MDITEEWILFEQIIVFIFIFRPDTYDRWLDHDGIRMFLHLCGAEKFGLQA